MSGKCGVGLVSQILKLLDSPKLKSTTVRVFMAMDNPSRTLHFIKCEANANKLSILPRYCFKKSSPFSPNMRTESEDGGVSLDQQSLPEDDKDALEKSLNIGQMSTTQSPHCSLELTMAG